MELKFRELLTFVYVLSLGYAKPQLLGHIAGNFHIGNDRAKLIDVTTALVPFIGYPMVLNAFAAIDEVSKRAKLPTSLLRLYIFQPISLKFHVQLGYLGLILYSFT